MNERRPPHMDMNRLAACVVAQATEEQRFAAAEEPDMRNPAGSP